ncbi:GntR family transcriptional regulator [Alkalilacustris brevis]|uniref:GntR family transcriptional regulator n=1 Tax=Alkalilacustris brevis TaxID=2026338 RepID=UPI000E0CE94E|nr:GntR family transcriptional regulator [Alkalilacustris brevis]
MQSGADSSNGTTLRRHGSLTATVHTQLEAMILRGDIAPGERLNEQFLSSQLGVSRGPVREAARLLEQDGLVTSVANQGAFVRQLSLEDALELYDLRATIAGYACSCLATRATESDLTELRALVQKMQDCIDSDEEETYFRLNLLFHDRIAVLSGASRTARIYSALDKQVRLLRRRVLRGDESMRFSNEEHREILAAIESGDAGRAREAAEKHHINGKRRWINTL